jgi:hypothetical protein
MWIGINDIGQTYQLTNVSLSDLYQTEMDQLHAFVTRIQAKASCPAWLFMTVPPIELAGGFSAKADLVKSAVGTWNERLYEMAGEFQEEVQGEQGSGNGTWVGVFDTQKVFRVSRMLRDQRQVSPPLADCCFFESARRSTTTLRRSAS